MPVDGEQVFKVLRAFLDKGVEFKIVGGVAVNFQGYPRATEDLDVFVRPTSENVSRLRDALKACYEDPSIDEITSEDLSGEYPAIQYVPPSGEFHIDILARLGEAFGFEDIEVEIREIEGLRLPVATSAMLIRMKKDTVRLKDEIDVKYLVELGRTEES